MRLIILLFATLFIGIQSIHSQDDKVFPDSLSKIYQGLKFRNIGPFRGGRSVASSGVIGDPNTYYMGSTGGGIWKTTDAGITWLNISDGFSKLALSARSL